MLSTAICDLGVVLAEEQTYKRLLDNGYIELNEEDLKLTSDELNQVRKYDYLITEIDNIEFHLSIIKKDNELKKDLIYNFYYKTNYEFDNYGITELKKRLDVHLKKAELGYDVYFAIKKNVFCGKKGNSYILK